MLLSLSLFCSLFRLGIIKFVHIILRRSIAKTKLAQFRQTRSASDQDRPSVAQYQTLRRRISRALTSTISARSYANVLLLFVLSSLRTIDERWRQRATTPPKTFERHDFASVILFGAPQRFRRLPPRPLPPLRLFGWQRQWRKKVTRTLKIMKNN